MADQDYPLGEKLAGEAVVGHALAGVVMMMIVVMVVHCFLIRIHFLDFEDCFFFSVNLFLVFKNQKSISVIC